MKSRLFLAAVLPSLLVVDGAYAQDPTNEDFLNCRRVSNAAARLSCYDALADSLSSDTSAESFGNSSIREAYTPRQPRRNANANASPNRSAIETARERAESNFGLRGDEKDKRVDNRRSQNSETEAILDAAREPEEISAKVTRVDENSFGRMIVYLDNDQIWMETSASRFRSSVDEGDVATVSKAGLGWYRMRFGDAYGVMAVKRVK